jgi:hypothetical protein
VRNHDQKIKNMSRSVLPSTGRKSARDNRRLIHQQQRARELAAVTAYRRDTDPDSVTPDIHGTYGPDIKQMVWDRRAQDKVGPLIRWAEATIAADPVLRSAPRADQVAYFARLMPDTLIGRHAVQHIEWALEWHERRARYNASRSTAPGPHVAEMQRQLRQILEAGLHATLNAGLRRLADTQEVRPRVTPMPRRLLLGSHDIEAFTTAMARWPTVRALVAVLAVAGPTPSTGNGGNLRSVMRPLCPVMPQLDIETFRAPIMIAGSFGLYSAKSARDHETVRHGTGHSCTVASMVTRRTGRNVAELVCSPLESGQASLVESVQQRAFALVSAIPSRQARAAHQRGGSGFRGDLRQSPPVARILRAGQILRVNPNW